MKKLLLLHLPLVGALAIAGLFDLLPQLRTERNFGWFVVVWAPLGALLGLTQVIIWIGWLVKRFAR